MHICSPSLIGLAVTHLTDDLTIRRPNWNRISCCWALLCRQCRLARYPPPLARERSYRLARRPSTHRHHPLLGSLSFLRLPVMNGSWKPRNSNPLSHPPWRPHHHRLDHRPDHDDLTVTAPPLTICIVLVTPCQSIWGEGFHARTRKI